MVIASFAAFGIIVSGVVVSVVIAGFMQWKTTVPDVVDDGLPLLVLALGMLMAGRVAVDVAGHWAPLAALGAAALTLAVGMFIERSTSGHGDAVEPLQVVIAALIVLVVTGTSGLIVQRRRR